MTLALPRLAALLALTLCATLPLQGRAGLVSYSTSLNTPGSGRLTYDPKFRS